MHSTRRLLAVAGTILALTALLMVFVPATLASTTHTLTIVTAPAP
jgi:hypothetical protein